MTAQNQNNNLKSSGNQKLIIGMVLGLLLGLFVALFALDYFPAISSFLLYLLMALFVLVMLGAFLYTWFKDRILKQIFGEDFKEENAKDDLKQVYEQVAINFVGQLLKDVPADKRERAQQATPRLLKLGVWAYTRSWVLRMLIAIFVAIGGLLGAILLYNQNEKIETQNTILRNQDSLIIQQNLLLGQQNNKITEQMLLDEANRRASLSSLISSILDRVNIELEDERNIERELSDDLIARIIAFTLITKPYNYLQDDMTITTKPLSPEKGQLLVVLSNCNLSDDTYRKMFSKSNFRDLDLRGISLDGAILKYVDLTNSDLSNSKIKNSNFDFANFENVNLENTVFRDVSLKNVRLKKTNCYGSYLASVEMNQSVIHSTNFRGTIIEDCKFQKSDFNDVDFSKSFIDSKTVFQESKLRNINLALVSLNERNWLYRLSRNNDIYDNELLEEYKVVDRFEDTEGYIPRNTLQPFVIHQQ